jgi:hypothetical protein
MTYDEANAARRATELQQYYTELFISWKTWPEAASQVLEELMGKEISIRSLTERRCRLARKVAADPDLVRRAMTYLRITGEVLFPASLGSRIFLEPQRLVDVMKVLVDHDLERRLKQLSVAPVSAAAAASGQICEFGERFLLHGELDRTVLLPWLWRDISPPIVHDPAQMDFVVELLVELGLLTQLSGSDQLLLPMRLPDRNELMAAARARLQFAGFLAGMAAAEGGGEAAAVQPQVGLVQAVHSIVKSGAMEAEQLERGLRIAFEKAKELIPSGELCDKNGLNSDQIAALNMCLLRRSIVYMQPFRMAHFAGFWVHV